MIGPLDTILLLCFGFLTIVGLAAAAWCFRKALTVASEKDGDLKMFLWGLGTLIGLIVAGMSAAYILLPILFHG
jgi:hypothetical protein